MAYKELIKNFNNIRDYMREFYVYGFRSREEFTQGSGRSYDNERRRIESWLGEYMQFRRTSEGKNVFLSIDSRISHHNPLYKAWKTKSFTDNDIMIHFLLMDILDDVKEEMSVNEIMKEIERYQANFENPKIFEESTVRKKLKEYVSEGILVTEKQGKIVCYRKSEDFRDYNIDMLNFFSEVSPCGVIGSFLLDAKNLSDREDLLDIERKKVDAEHLLDTEWKKSGVGYLSDTEQKKSDREYFAFKHHYITSALDSEIVCQLFGAMHEKRSIVMNMINREKKSVSQNYVIPLRIMSSVQNGRQYLMAYAPRFRKIMSYRIDNILSVKYSEKWEQFDELRERLDSMKEHMWGVSTQSKAGRNLEKVTFTVCYEEEEEHIHRRLEREKRCGIVEKIAENKSRFTAEVYDAYELIPWIRTFICRITEIHFSNPVLEKQFKEDIEEMYKLYGLEGEA